MSGAAGGTPSERNLRNASYVPCGKEKRRDGRQERQANVCVREKQAEFEGLAIKINSLLRLLTPVYVV